MDVAVIVGLGNPGERYALTRHNLGFLVLDALLRAFQGTWSTDLVFNAQIGRIDILGKKVFLVKPLTFMNLSGESVGRFCRYYRISVDQVCVVHDDIAFSLGVGKLNLVKNGGGHNGVTNIIQHIGKSFLCYRLGIGGHRALKISLADYVLAPFSELEKQVIQQHLSDFVHGLTVLVDKGSVKAMNVINSS